MKIISFGISLLLFMTAFLPVQAVYEEDDDVSETATDNIVEVIDIDEETETVEDVTIDDTETAIPVELSVKKIQMVVLLFLQLMKSLLRKFMIISAI